MAGRGFEPVTAKTLLRRMFDAAIASAQPAVCIPSHLPPAPRGRMIVIGAGKPPGGPELVRVIDLVDAGLVTVLTTDLTLIEIAKKHAQNDFNLIKDICQPHFRKVVEAATGTALPEAKRTQLKQRLNETYEASTKAMFNQLRAKTLAIDDVKPSVVFATYAAGIGFFTGEGKKDQFPDAFVFECLKQEATKSQPVIIVSQDGDFVAPTKGERHIALVKSLPELFAALGLEMEAPEVDEFLEAYNAQLVEVVDQELSDWGLQGDVEDSEIDETTVTEVQVEKLSAFKPTKHGDPILVVGRLVVKATVSYTHPNWDTAMYDSEDKILIPFEDVSGETDVDLQIDVSMSIAVDDDGEPRKIEELRFRNDDFVYVEIHSYDPYEHM